MDFRIKEDRSMNQREICDRVEIDSQDNKARYQSLLDWQWTEVRSEDSVSEKEK